MGGRGYRAASTPDVKLLFADYLPDLPDHLSPGVAEAVNVYPGSAGYRPVGAFLALGSALPSACLGAGSFVSDAGIVTIVAGTATGLYKQVLGGWTLMGGGYAVPINGRWRFAQFGGFAVATNGFNPMVKIDLTAGTVSNLGGTPPTAESLAVVYNFLVGIVIDGKKNRIAWSGENNAEWWTYAQRKSDYNDFADGGEITGLIGGEIGLVLQRNAVRRMAYVGGNVLFRFDKISANVGCSTVHSVGQHGELAFWYSDNGFKMWDGAQIKSIGYEKVDATFAAENGVASFPALSTAVDGQRSTVCWSTGTKCWIYNWLLDRWSTVSLGAQIVATGVSRAPTIDEQDPTVGVLDDLIDAPGLVSFDDPRFRDGEPRFYVVQNGILGILSGMNMAATVAGRRVEIAEKRDARLNRVRPMTDATAGVTLTLDAWQRLGDTARTKTATALNASGEMPVRQRGRFVKARVEIAAGTTWSYLQGIDATVVTGGAR